MAILIRTLLLSVTIFFSLSFLLSPVFAYEAGKEPVGGKTCVSSCVSGSTCVNGGCTCLTQCARGCGSDGSCSSNAASSSKIYGTNLSDLGLIINRVITFLFGIIGGIAIIMIVLGGIRYILAGGDPKAVAATRAQLTFAILGLIIVLLAVSIITIVGSTLGIKDLNILSIPLPGQQVPIR